MKKYLYLLVLFAFFFGCSAQKKYKTIDKSNYRLITTFSLKEEKTTKFLKSEAEIDNFYDNFDRSFKRSMPRFVIDFNEKQVALIYKNHINSYNIDSISGNDKIYQINLSLVEGFDIKNDPSNFIMVIIPKTIEKITVKENL